MGWKPMSQTRCSSNHDTCAARMNASIFSGDFRPGEDSTPVLTSTAHGCTARTTSATLSAVNPPAADDRRQADEIAPLAMQRDEFPIICDAAATD